MIPSTQGEEDPMNMNTPASFATGFGDGDDLVAPEPMLPMPHHPHRMHPGAPVRADALAPETIAAMRAECRKLVDAEDFLNSLPLLENAARAMRQLAIVLDPAAMLAHGPKMHPAWMSSAYGAMVANPGNLEQFGARAIRELVAAMGPKKTEEDPVKLVTAIGIARERGLTGLADKLEAALLSAYGGAEEPPRTEPPTAACLNGAAATEHPEAP
jgi:hypothetical protein